MKSRRIKALCSLLSALVLLACFTASAFAADASIEFGGFGSGFSFTPGNNYTRTDLFGNFKNVMPGDVLTQKITFTNSAEDCDFIDLYMRAVVHDEAGNRPSPIVAASGETAVSMTDFLSRFSVKVRNGAELIYDAAPNTRGALEENHFLGTFRSGETAVLTVELTVPETLGNEYANRLGEVDWIFHAEAWNESQLTVRKLWSDGSFKHADDSVTVNLMKDGVFERSEVLNTENQWTFTFDRLADGHTWTVEEADVPDGYTAVYEVTGNTVVITNKCDQPPPSGDPINLTVRKVWADENKTHPDFVTVTLYNGSDAVETVRLNKQNNWSHKWSGLSPKGNWQIIETNIPKGYTPSYSIKNGVVTITNTATLIKTGQLNWPIPVLAVTGLILIAFGFIVVRKNKKRALK